MHEFNKRRLALIFALFLVFLISSPGMAGENCSMMAGTCRDACGQDQKAEPGDFMDCGEQQKCCVARSGEQIECCIASFDPKRYGAGNCSLPKDTVCPKGWSGSPLPCEKLKMCKE